MLKILENNRIYMDFTLKQYKTLLKCLLKASNRFMSFEEYLRNISADKQEQKVPESMIILRHDVDLKPKNSLEFAKIQASYGVKGSYYFRMVPESFDEKIILEIASMGHEIGYHYETMDTAAQKLRSNGQKTLTAEMLIDKAYQEFSANLAKFRKIIPVKTICMHGSPRSAWDNKAIWSIYSYRDLGLSGEPYYDIDFTQVAYYTDTARMWDGGKYSIRDKVESGINTHAFPVFHSTNEMVMAINQNRFPKKAMFTFHPQRWTDRPIPWAKELIMQNVKNIVKNQIVKKHADRQLKAL